jgi:hypothetical protein
MLWQYKTDSFFKFNRPHDEKVIFDYENFGSINFFWKLPLEFD